MTYIQLPAKDEWQSRKKSVMLDTGIKMAYAEVGDTDKPAFILMHGHNEHSRTWRELATHIDHDFHIFAVDCRGHGDTDKPDLYMYSINDMSDDIISFADKMGLDRFYVGGCSMGSMIAQAVAYKLGDRVLGVLLASSMCHRFETPEQTRATLEEFRHMACNPDITLDEHIPRHAYYEDTEFAAEMYKSLLKWPEHCWIAGWLGLMNCDNRNFLQFITAPVLVAWGGDDAFVTPEMRDEMRELLPAARFVEYEGVSHEMQQEKPSLLAEDIKRFFLE